MTIFKWKIIKVGIGSSNDCFLNMKYEIICLILRILFFSPLTIPNKHWDNSLNTFLKKGVFICIILSNMHSFLVAVVFGISILQCHFSLMDWVSYCHPMTSALPSYFTNSLFSNYYSVLLFESSVFNIPLNWLLCLNVEKNGAKFIIYLINSDIGEFNLVVLFSE